VCRVPRYTGVHSGSAVLEQVRCASLIGEAIRAFHVSQMLQVCCNLDFIFVRVVGRDLVTQDTGSCIIPLCVAFLSLSYEPLF
jgi:hypothetical protein